jgi:hypothetical protein
MADSDGIHPSEASWMPLCRASYPEFHGPSWWYQHSLSILRGALIVCWMLAVVCSLATVVLVAYQLGA